MGSELPLLRPGRPGGVPRYCGSLLIQVKVGNISFRLKSITKSYLKRSSPAMFETYAHCGMPRGRPPLLIYSVSNVTLRGLTIEQAWDKVSLDFRSFLISLSG